MGILQAKKGKSQEPADKFKLVIVTDPAKIEKNKKRLQELAELYAISSETPHSEELLQGLALLSKRSANLDPKFTLEDLQQLCREDGFEFPTDISADAVLAHTRKFLSQKFQLLITKDLSKINLPLC